MSDSGSAPAGTPPVTPATPPAWFDAFDPDLKGYVTNRGLDKGDVVEAFKKTATAHREAEKFIGQPADKILRIPDSTDAEAMTKMWQRLGAPLEAKAYDFKEAGEINDDFAAATRESLFKLGIPKEKGEALVKDILAIETRLEKAEFEAKKAEVQTQINELKKNWGADYDLKMRLADRAATTLGISETAMKTLMETVSFREVIEMFDKIASQIGEDKFVKSEFTGTIMTPQGAKERITALMGDNAWRGKYLSGDTAAVKEMTDLQKLATPEAA